MGAQLIHLLRREFRLEKRCEMVQQAAAEAIADVVVASTRQPLVDGARALAAIGLTGPVELWDEVRPFPRMRSTVEAAAGLTVQEGKRQSAKFTKWVPFEGPEQAT